MSRQWGPPARTLDEALKKANRNGEKVPKEEKGEKKMNETKKDQVPQDQAQSTGQQAQAKSLNEKLTNLLDLLESPQGIIGQADEADKCLQNPGLVGRYAGVIRKTDAWAIAKLPGDKDKEGKVITLGTAKAAWNKMGWDGQLEKFQEWAKDNDLFAQKILEVFEEFNSNVLFRDPLRRVIDRFEKPLREIISMEELKIFLDRESGAENPIVQKVFNAAPRGETEQAVIILWDNRRTLYQPRKGIILAEAGWVFVKEAEERVRKTWEPIEKLMRSATRGLTPYKISRGQDGLLFVKLGPTEAVLLEAFGEGGRTKIRFIDSAGLDPKQLDQVTGDLEVQLWDEQDSSIKDPQSDLWYDIGRIIYNQNREDYKRVMAQKASREKSYERFSALSEGATFKSHPKDLGMTKLMEGKEGSVGFWMDNFEWGREEKFSAPFGIKIQHKDGKFILLDAISDHPTFDESLIGKELLIGLNERNQPTMLINGMELPDKEYQTLKMIQQLIRLRLNLESRFAS